MDRTASDTVLNIWRQLCVKGEEVMPLATFTLCAEAWERIRKMEEAADSRERTLEALLQAPPVVIQESTPGRVEKVHTDEGEKVHIDADKKYTEYVDYTEADKENAGQASQAPTPPPEGAEGMEGFEVVQIGPKKRDNEAAGKKAYAARKENLREAMDRVRAAGVSMQSIADACGLTLNDVLDFLEGKAVPLPKLAKLGKGLGALEGKT